MSTVRRTIPLVLLALAPCQREAPANHRVEELPAGGRVVTNTGVPSWSSSTRWTAEVDLQIGGIESSGPAEFGLVTALQVSEEGVLYVFDYASREVRTFDASGAFLWSIGGPGEGPGEFASVAALHLSPDRELVVVDLGNARYSVVGENGEMIRTGRRAIQGSAPFGGFLPNGSYLEWGTAFPDEGPDVVAGHTVMFTPFLLSATFSPVDSMPPIEFTSQMTADGTRPQVFFANRLVGFQDDLGGVWFAESRDYRVFRRDLDGDTTLIFSMAADAAPIMESDREAVRTRLASRPEMIRIYLEGLPDRKPVIRGLFGDGSRHIYVVPELDGVAAGSALDVFRATGEYLGRIDLAVPMYVPGSGPVAVATDDLLYYVAADTLDVPRVLRARIVKP